MERHDTVLLTASLTDLEQLQIKQVQAGALPAFLAARLFERRKAQFSNVVASSMRLGDPRPEN